MNESGLLKSIITKAKDEAADIVSRAENSVNESRKASETRIKNIQAETDKKAAARLAEMKKRTESAIKAEERRARLRMREKVNAEVVSVFYDKIESLIGTEEYNSFIAKLIAEGAIAVNDSEVRVSCSFKEKISESNITEAQIYIKKHIGREIIIKLSDKPPLNKQGIVVESSSGRIAYNNQIDSRLRRFDEDIKMIIINGLDKE